MKKVLLAALSILLLTAGMAAAADDASWLQIGGDYRFRYDSLEGKVHDYIDSGMRPGSTAGPTSGYTVKDNSLMTNRFGINLKANPLEDVTVKARLVMYKVFGHQSSTPALGDFFADRFGATNDGTVGHVPQDSVMRADYAYATVSNVFNAPLWISVGRRPSTGGVPSNIRQDEEKTGTAGIPSIMVNYAFDGYTIGYAPDIAALPGSYVKFCGGRGFDSGFQGPTNGLKDTDFYGLNVAPYDTETLHIELQYQLGKNIFDQPSDAGVTANLGDIKWVGGVVTSKVGGLNMFLSAAQSKTDPNGNTTMGGLAGLMNNGSSKVSHSGTAVYAGGRYDFATGTKIGVEYNQGSKNWIGMVPADDDIWTSKLGTRGSVYEVYLIQELQRKAISPKGKAFVKLGYQQYKFDYTGSNNWVGAPVKITDLTASPMNAQYFVPLKDATDIYLTFNVQF